MQTSLLGERDLCNHLNNLLQREERQALGRPVDNLGGGGVGYEALGGITSFSSLIDGIDRLDASGAGGQRVGKQVREVQIVKSGFGLKMSFPRLEMAKKSAYLRSDRCTGD